MILIFTFEKMQFKEIIAQDSVKNRLTQSVKDSRISHAQLFLGKSGSGSLALAVAYAQYIFCKNRTESDSCGICPACNKVSKLIHPDLHFAYPVALSKDVRTSTNVIAEWREAFLSNPYLNIEDWFNYLEAENKQPVIATEESAEILRKLNLTAYESEYKIMIIWMAEKLNPAAANKLLKILEEPPEKTLFILVCENEDQLLRTILSRTQLIKINKIADADLKNILVSKHNISETNATQIAFLADGNYNEALKHLEVLEEENFNFISFRDWMRLCLTLDIEKLIPWIDAFSKNGREKQKNFLLYALQISRECMMMNYGGSALVKLENEELTFANKFAPFINGNNAEKFIDELNKAHYHLERNANPKILFLDLSFILHDALKAANPVAVSK